MQSFEQINKALSSQNDKLAAEAEQAAAQATTERREAIIERLHLLGARTTSWFLRRGHDIGAFSVSRLATVPVVGMAGLPQVQLLHKRTPAEFSHMDSRETRIRIRTRDIDTGALTDFYDLAQARSNYSLMFGLEESCRDVNATNLSYVHNNDEATYTQLHQWIAVLEAARFTDKA